MDKTTLSATQATHGQTPLVSRADYRERGIVVAKGLIPKAMTDAVLSDHTDVFDYEMRHLGLPTEPFDTIEGFGANLRRLLGHSVERYIACCKVSQYSIALHRLSLSAEIEQLLSDLGLDQPIVNSRPVCHFTSDALVIPGGYHKSPPHQDWRSMQGSLDAVVLWLPLTPITADGHPVEFVAGSHKLGLLNTEPHPATPQVVDSRITDEKFVPYYSDVGDVVAFSAFTVHRTSPKGQNPRLRMAVSFRYNNLSEPTFVERGYPIPYSYKYTLDVLHPELDTEAGARRTFN